MTEYSERLSVVVSQNGRRSYRFEAPLLEGYTLGGEPYREFRRGVEVFTYLDDSLSTVDATLRANYAIFYPDRQLWEARGDVAVEKHDGKRLYTQQLFWNARTRKIYSNVDSKFVHPRGVSYGEGFEADEDFRSRRRGATARPRATPPTAAPTAGVTGRGAVPMPMPMPMPMPTPTPTPRAPINCRLRARGCAACPTMLPGRCARCGPSASTRRLGAPMRRPSGAPRQNGFRPTGSPGRPNLRRLTAGVTGRAHCLQRAFRCGRCDGRRCAFPRRRTHSLRWAHCLRWAHSLRWAHCLRRALRPRRACGPGRAPVVRPRVAPRCRRALRDIRGTRRSSDSCGFRGTCCRRPNCAGDRLSGRRRDPRNPGRPLLSGRRRDLRGRRHPRRVRCACGYDCGSRWPRNPGRDPRNLGRPCRPRPLRGPCGAAHTPRNHDPTLR